MKVLKAAVLLAATLSASVFAQTSLSFNINSNQAHQSHRIHQGVTHHQLTPYEVAKLKRGQARVQRIEHQARQDSRITARERAQILQAQAVQSKRIYNERHDKNYGRQRVVYYKHIPVVYKF